MYCALIGLLLIVEGWRGDRRPSRLSAKWRVRRFIPKVQKAGQLPSGLERRIFTGFA